MVVERATEGTAVLETIAVLLHTRQHAAIGAGRDHLRLRGIGARLPRRFDLHGLVATARVAIAHARGLSVEIDGADGNLPLQVIIIGRACLGECIGLGRGLPMLHIIERTTAVVPCGPGTVDIGGSNTGRAPGTAIEAGRAHSTRIDANQSLSIAVVAGIAGERGSRRMIGTIAVAARGRGPACRRVGQPCGDPLIIGDVLALPDMPTGIIDFTMTHLVDVVVDLGPHRRVSGGVRPLLRHRRRIRAARHLLQQIVIPPEGAKGLRCAVVIVGIVLLHPRRVGIAGSRLLVIGRATAGQHHFAGNVRAVGGIAITRGVRRIVAGIGVERLAVQFVGIDGSSFVDILLVELPGGVVATVSFGGAPSFGTGIVLSRHISRRTGDIDPGEAMEFPMIVVLPVPFALGIPGVARTVGESCTISRTRSPPVRHLVGIGRRGWSQAARTAIGAHRGDGMHDLYRPRFVTGIGKHSGTGRIRRAIGGIVAIIAARIGGPVRVVVASLIRDRFSSSTAMIVVGCQIVPVVAVAKGIGANFLSGVDVIVMFSGIGKGDRRKHMGHPTLIDGWGNAVEDMLSRTPGIGSCASIQARMIAPLTIGEAVTVVGLRRIACISVSSMYTNRENKEYTLRNLPLVFFSHLHISPSKDSCIPCRVKDPNFENFTATYQKAPLERSPTSQQI